jgi:hypothetical protein
MDVREDDHRLKPVATSEYPDGTPAVAVINLAYVL